MRNPPNWLCRHPKCHRMADTVFELRPLCRQHMLERVQELIPRNRAEQRNLARQTGQLGKTRRLAYAKGPSKWKSTMPAWQRRMLEAVYADLQAKEAAEPEREDADLPEWDNPGSPVNDHKLGSELGGNGPWMETESGLSVPSR